MERTAILRECSTCKTWIPEYWELCPCCESEEAERETYRQRKLIEDLGEMAHRLQLKVKAVRELLAQPEWDQLRPTTTADEVTELDELLGLYPTAQAGGAAPTDADLHDPEHGAAPPQTHPA